MSHAVPARTWSPAHDSEIPDLERLPGVVGTGEPPTVDLVITYLDTPDLALARAGATLCARAGGEGADDGAEGGADDGGWHLSMAGGDETHRPVGDDPRTPPPELLDVAARRLGDRVGLGHLRAVAEIRTRRARHDLRGEGGRVLATLEDERVTAVVLDADGADAGEPVTWRTWELTLVDGDEEVLAAADARLAALGVGRTTVPGPLGLGHADRLARAMAAEAAWTAAGALARVDRPAADGPARRVVHARLVVLAAALLRHDTGARRDVPDAVHRLRVTCRRLRALLATCRPVLDREVTDPLRDGLRTAARGLGDARDAEVSHAVVGGLLAAEPASLSRGPVAARLAAGEEDRAEAARSGVAAVLEGAAYVALLDDVSRLVLDPPWTGRADEPAGEVLRARVAKDFRRLRRRVRAAEELREQPDHGEDHDEGHDEALHDARKAAKRLRYSCEVLEPAWPEAKGLRKAAKRVASVLGERQDTTVSRALLAELAADAEAAGEPSFTWGRLHGLEQARAAERERTFRERAWPRVAKKKRRSWLT